MNQIPYEVDAAVRALSRTAGAYPGELEGVYRRARQRRTRRLAATVTFAGVAATAVTAGVVLPPSPSPSPAPPPVAAAATSAAAAEPAQRLLLRGASGSYRSASAAVLRLGGAANVGEIRADGRLLRHAVVGADGWDRSVGLADGRIVALGPRDTMPGVERPDGVDVTGLKINLVVTGPGGAIRTERDVRRTGEPVALLTADTTTAYLWRPTGLVAHDLATGAERLLVSRKALGVPGILDGSIEAADLVGGRLVTSRTSTPCEVSVLDTGPDTIVAGLQLPGSNCRAVTGLQLSPAATTVAITYQVPDFTAGYRIALVRIRDGATLVDRAITGTARAASAKHEQVLVDVAWQDDRTLRGVVVPIGPGTHDLTPFTINAD